MPCDDPNCYVKRIPDNQTKRLIIETPKLSVERPGHYADSQEMTHYKENGEHVQCAVDIINSSGLLEKPINSSTFWEKDYFTPTKHVSECFTIQDLEGNREDKFQKFTQVFPTETGSIVDALRKGRRSANMVQVDAQWFPDNQTPIEEYFSKSVPTLSRCLEVICRCTNSNCFYRVRGVKYDIVCRLYEHVHKTKNLCSSFYCLYEDPRSQRKAQGKRDALFRYRRGFEGAAHLDDRSDMHPS